MTHRYKRRTWTEALELAKAAFRATVADHLTSAEIDELRQHAAITGGSLHDQWAEVLGAQPEERAYYQVELYRPSDQCPYVEKVFVRMLVPRDRSTETVHFIWRPVDPPYTGPYFE